MNALKRVRCQAALERAQNSLKAGQSEESIQRGVSFPTWEKRKLAEIATLKSKLGIK